MLASKDKVKLMEAIKSSGKYEDGKRCIMKKGEAFLKNNFRMQDIPDDKKIFKEDVVKVYFVSGVLHRQKKSTIFKNALKNALRNAKRDDIEVASFDDIFYLHLEYRKIEGVIMNIKNTLASDSKYILRKNGKIVIFAHSWGGILAKTAIDRFLKEIKNGLTEKKYNRLKNNIALITMGTPHSMKYGKVNVAKATLGTSENIKGLKIITFGGIFDIVVPAKFAHIKHNEKATQRSAKNTIGKDLKTTHLMFLNSKQIHKEIFNNVFKERQSIGIITLLRDILRSLRNLLGYK